MRHATLRKGRDRIIALLPHRWQRILSRRNYDSWTSSRLIRIACSRHQLGCAWCQSGCNLVTTIPTKRGTIIYGSITSRTDHDLFPFLVLVPLPYLREMHVLNENLSYFPIITNSYRVRNDLFHILVEMYQYNLI
jgi:hypothetical protein